MKLKDFPDKIKLFLNPRIGRINPKKKPEKSHSGTDRLFEQVQVDNDSFFLRIEQENRT